MRHPGRFFTFLVTATVLLILAHLLDSWAYRHLVNHDVYNHDWGRLLRVMGYLPTWLLAAGAMAMLLTGRSAARGLGQTLKPAILLALAPALAGLVAEVLKILIRRQRPEAGDGQYLFRPWSEKTFSTSGLGAPSSHAAVAFGAAFILCRLYPRAWPVWLLLAGGCAWTRVQDQAHFLSDVTIAAVAAYVVVWLLNLREKTKSLA